MNCLRRPFQGRALPVSYLGTVRSNDFTENAGERKVKTQPLFVARHENNRRQIRSCLRKLRRTALRGRDPWPLRPRSTSRAAVLDAHEDVLLHVADDGEKGGGLDRFGENFELVSSGAGFAQKVESGGLTGEENHAALRE